MELKISEILIVKAALKEFDKKEVPSKLSYWLGRLEDKIDPICNRFDKENSRLICDKYGVENPEKKNNFQVPKEKMGDYVNEINALVEVKEEIFIRIKLELFEGVNTSKEFFRALGDIIEVSDVEIIKP